MNTLKWKQTILGGTHENEMDVGTNGAERAVDRANRVGQAAHVRAGFGRARSDHGSDAQSRGQAAQEEIIFTAEHLKVENGWAYFGGRFDYAAKSRVSADFGWGNLSCLLRYEKKAWRVKRFIHNTDVAEPDYIERFPQAPRAIFQREYR